jgi:hypothetical protein
MVITLNFSKGIWAIVFCGCIGFTVSTDRSTPVISIFFILNHPIAPSFKFSRPMSFAPLGYLIPLLQEFYRVGACEVVE